MIKEITLPVAELRAALPGLGRIIGRGKSLPVLQSVRITRDHEGQVKLHATDLDSFVSFNVSGHQEGGPVDMVVPYDQLSRATKSTSGKESITLLIEAKDRVKIRRSIVGNVIEQSFSTVSPEEWPEGPQVRQPGVALEPGFGKAFKEALELSSDDASRYVLQGAYLDVSDKKAHYIISTNGRALYSANSFGFKITKSIIIPDSKFLSATDLMDEEPCFLSVEPGQEKQEATATQKAQDSTAGWVKLESSRWSFITREIEGNYPNWKQVVPRTDTNWTTIDFSDDAVQQMLKVIPNLPGSEPPNYAVTLAVDGHLVLSGRNQEDQDWTRVPISTVNVHGNPVRVCLNRDYLMKALRFGFKRLLIQDSLSPVLFKDKGRKMVVMPIRLEGDEPQPGVPAQPPSTPPQDQPQQPEQITPPQQPEAQTKERTQMAKTATSRIPAETNGESAAPEVHNRNAGVNGQSNGSGTESEVKSVVEQIDRIKDALKDVIRSLGDVTDSLKQAEKEKRTTEKEVEAIRAKLRQIQSVTI